MNYKNASPGQHEDNKTDSEIRKYFLKDAHTQLFVRFSFKLFIIVDVDKIDFMMTINLEVCIAKLKNKDMLSNANFVTFSEILSYLSKRDFNFKQHMMR